MLFGAVFNNGYIGLTVGDFTPKAGYNNYYFNLLVLLVTMT